MAHWTLKLIASMIPAYLTEIIQFSLSMPVLLFGAALALGAGLFFGLFPALHCTRSDLASSLKGQAGRQTGAGLGSRFRTYLSTAQIALSLALLVAAGLFAKNLYNLNHVDLGLKAENIITFKISPSLNGYTAQRSLQLYERLEDEVAALPGVGGVSNSLWPLLGGMGALKEVSVQGYDMEPDTDMGTLYDAIGPAYFRTLGIQLIAGREFVRSDAAGRPSVAIVNEAFADKFKLGRNAVGKRIGSRYGPRDTEIVGLVRNAKYADRISQPPPLVYHPYRQYFPTADLTFYVKTSGNNDSLMPAIIRSVAKLDPQLPVERLGGMPQQLRERFWGDRVGSFLTTSFACLAILLTALGLYGVLSYAVTRRTREIGLRIALGASLAQVRGMVFRQVGIMTLVGCVSGLALAAGLSRLMRSFIYFYQVGALDPALFLGSTAIVVLVALLAGFVPAYRASRVDPMRALRYE